MGENSITIHFIGGESLNIISGDIPGIIQKLKSEEWVVINEHHVKTSSISFFSVYEPGYDKKSEKKAPLTR
ncbi:MULTISPECIES: hypothetical protein [Paenibacillus]|uniref:Uncharacterized protein n=1 Tax=Paenibacillus azoreducens TaxID=116718 RepID=A0A919YGN6_9BACL|nr:MULTISPECIES: hypothetical protein [Paenibacillus]MBE9918004.1 hypothetical protein [Paenibacillus donghaensis]GIO50144.1 hypothetical protein J34TS1_49090 [Paenibacillus azoreducens]